MSPESSAPDLSTVYGRFLHFLSVTDPRTLIYSDAEVRRAQEALKQQIQAPAAERHAWQRIVDAAVHPGTGQIIPQPFRVSAIAPVNIPIVFAMIACPASNVPATLFLHWLNQSYNTVCNYYNRSGDAQPLPQIAKAYGLAVSSACAFAYGLGRAFARGPASLQRFGAVIPCLSTAIASSSNLGFTRYDEIVRGVNVTDEQGNVHGLSKTAGLQVVAQTAVTRCVLVPCACLLLPPLGMAALRRFRLLPASRAGLIATELSIIYLSLQAAMPAALAVFPQTAIFKAQDLEPEFHALKDTSGRPITVLYANKGL